MTTEELVERLEEADVGLRRNGDTWRGGCPACGGADRLTVSEDLNGNPFLKCYGRCDRDEILAAVDLTWCDLRGEEAESRVEAIRHALFVEPRGLDDDGEASREPLEGGAELLYKGQAASVFSERGAGKSSLATMLGCSVAAAGGKTYYWDRENSRQLSGARVNAILEAHEDWPDVRGETFFYAEYPRLEPDWTPEAFGEVFDGFALVIYDSMREAVAQLGGDPNVEKDISAFVDLAVTPVTARGGAVLALDNVGHEFVNRPRGSGAKLDVIPQAFKVTAAIPFSAVDLGRIEVECMRSRFGDLGRVWTMPVGAGTWDLPRARDENPDQRAAREIADKSRAFERTCITVLKARAPLGRNALVDALRERGLKGRTTTWDHWLEELVESEGSKLAHGPDGYYLGPEGGVSQRGVPRGVPPGIDVSIPPGTEAEPVPVAKEKETAPPRRETSAQLLDDVVVFDVETTGLDCRADELRLVCFARGMLYEVFEHPRDRDRIQEWLSLELPFVAHNIGFDLGFLEQNGYWLPPPERWHDTTLIAHIAGRRLPGQTALKSIAREHVKDGELPECLLAGERDVKAWLRQARREAKKKGSRVPQLGDAPRRLLEPYLRADVQLTQWAHGHYTARLNGQTPILELERRLLPVIHDAEKRGVPIDVEAAKAFRADARSGVKRLLERVRELAADPELNPASTRQVEAALAARGADLSRLPRTEKTKAVMLTAQALESIDDELAQALLELRAEKKMSDYAEGLFRHTHGDRLYGSFRQVGTATGRMSSGHPNLQNFPRDDPRIRRLICAGEGKVLVGADLDSVELRLLAHYAPGGALEAAFTNGTDPHQRTADALGIGRAEGKRVNFAILYGAGAPLISEILDCRRVEARAALDRWYGAYPEVGQLKAQIKDRLDQRGYITTLLGRQQHIERNRRYQALNYLIQGSAADLFKRAAIDVHEAGLEPILFVHDEIVLEVDEDQAHDAGPRLSALLSSGAGQVAGLHATAAAARRWADFEK